MIGPKLGIRWLPPRFDRPSGRPDLNQMERRDSVLDPFAGSGTTLIACERLERKACLIELDPRYADVICERWEQYGGKPAIREGDAAPYAELAQERRKHASKAAPTRRPRK
jgi:tRNA G10  N-methylase Trm11